MRGCDNLRRSLCGGASDELGLIVRCVGTLISFELGSSRWSDLRPRYPEASAARWTAREARIVHVLLSSSTSRADSRHDLAGCRRGLATSPFWSCPASVSSSYAITVFPCGVVLST